MRRAAMVAAVALAALAAGAAAGEQPAAKRAAAGPAAAERPVAPQPAGGVAYEGRDRVVVRLAPDLAAAAGEYANNGYRLRRGASGGEVVVEVSLAPLASRAPFSLAGAEGEATRDAGAGAAAGGARSGHAAAPAAAGRSATSAGPARPAAAGEVAGAARSAAAGAATVYEAVSGVLGWIVHHVAAAEGAAAGPAAGAEAGRAGRARVAAGVPAGRSGAAPAVRSEVPPPSRPAVPPVRSPAAVLADGAGDAAEVAALAVAMLDALGIEARTAHGLVVGPPRPGAPRGAHVWIEVRYPDRGWAFSDPLYHHHYVPASYLRLGAGAGGAAELVARDDRRTPVDVYPPGGPGVGARRNDEAQVAAALRVVVPGAVEGVAVLTTAGGATHRRALRDGEGVFVGLAGGAYTLEVLVPGRPRLARALELAPRERSAVLFGEAAARSEPAGAEPAPPPPRQRPGGARRLPR